MMKNLNPKDRVCVILIILLFSTLLCIVGYQAYHEYQKREEIDKILIENNLAIYTVDIFGNKRLELIKKDDNENVKEKQE